MSTATAKPYITLEQYEDLEERSQVRHEYYRGEIFAMAGANENHNLVAGNLFGELRNRFEARACKAYQNDMRVKIQATGLYTYPDVVAVCGPALFDSDKKTTLLNPTLIVEVLSPSTEIYDRSTKLDHYKTVDSIREIALVTQDRPRVDLLTKVEGQWIWSSIVGLDGNLRLHSIECEIPMARIYAKVELPGESLRPVVNDDDDRRA